jgi:hypothetical protein
MNRWWLAMLATAGCDRVLSLSEVQVSKDETTVSVHGISRTVINDANHLPTTHDAPFSTQLIQHAFAVLDSGERTGMHVDPTDPAGSCYFNRVDSQQRYRFVVPSTTADLAPIEYQLVDGNLELLDRSWGRSSLAQPPAEQAPGPGSQLKYVLSVPSPGVLPTPSGMAVATVESSGLWTETVVATGSTSLMPGPLDWASAASLYGPVYLLDGSNTIRDRAYFTLRDYLAMGYRVIVGYRFDDVQMKDGMVTTAGGQYFMQPQDTCVHVDLQLDQAAAAVSVLGTPTKSWKIEAVPVTEMGPDVGFEIAEGQSPMQDVTFGSPFSGYGFYLEMDATVPHPILAPGANVAMNEFAGSTHWTVAASTAMPSGSSPCQASTQVLARIAVPTTPLIDGAAISTDRVLEVDRSRPAQLTWTLSQGGQAQLYRADLFGVVNDAGKTSLEHVVRILSTNTEPDGTPLIEIDPTYFSPGGTYVIEVVDELTYQNLGDFTLLDSDPSRGYAWSGLLTVTK